MPLYRIRLQGPPHSSTVTTVPLGTWQITLERLLLLRVERRYTKELLGWRTVAEVGSAVGAAVGAPGTGVTMVPGTVEVTVRVMGENGEWMERSVRTESGVSVGTFDVTSREGYLDCFDCLEQAIIQARNEASRETAEAFLKEVGKKRKT